MPSPTWVSTLASGAPFGEPITSRFETTPSRTEEPPPIGRRPVPVVLPPAAAATWRGPADGPAGRSECSGPRTTGPEAVPTSTAEARAATTELTAETRSTTVDDERLICF